jgi:hypothetical protein
MTTKSQTLQIIAAATVGIMTGAAIQRVVDTKDFEYSLKRINERCNNDPSKVPGGKLPPPLGTADLKGDG